MVELYLEVNADWLILADRKGRRAERLARKMADPMHRRKVFFKAIADGARPAPGVRWYDFVYSYGIDKVTHWRVNRYCSCHMCSFIKASDRRRVRHRVRCDMRGMVRTGYIPDVLPLYERNYLD